ncbi:unnamed protein product [Mycena citricolor]|uniref:Uncharacterized protein n=1 Tax=Mycena citricolor TaxID=2018698 RepID=A0AAD2HSJ4_9AGAR|nr:unnamed protein product [Mycena citricolor]
MLQKVLLQPMTSAPCDSNAPEIEMESRAEEGDTGQENTRNNEETDIKATGWGSPIGTGEGIEEQVDGGGDAAGPNETLGGNVASTEAEREAEKEDEEDTLPIFFTESRIEDINITNTFIQLIHGARLDDQCRRLSHETIQQIRNPLRDPPVLTLDKKLSIDVYFAVNGHASIETYESMH